MLIKEALILIPFFGRLEKKEGKYSLFDINSSEALFPLFLLFWLAAFEKMLSFK